MIQSALLSQTYVTQNIWIMLFNTCRSCIKEKFLLVYSDVNNQFTFLTFMLKSHAEHLSFQKDAKQLFKYEI